MTPEDLAWMKSEFERCKEWIQAALDRAPGEYELHHIWGFIESGKAQLWPTANACMVTNIEEFPTGLRVLRGWLSGGDLNEIQKSEPIIAAWAKKSGFDRVRIGGRKGWLRAFNGYREYCTVMEKDLRT